MTKAEKRALDAYPRKGVKKYDDARAYFVQGYEMAIKDIFEDSIPASVWTNDNPKNLMANSDKWNELLGRFENGEHVRMALIRVYSADAKQ